MLTTVRIHILNVLLVALKYKCLYAATPVSYVPGKQNVIQSMIVHSRDFMSVFMCMQLAINPPLKTVSQQEHEQKCLSTLREKSSQKKYKIPMCMGGKNTGARQPHKTASQLPHLPGDFLSAVGSPYLSMV